MSFLRRTDRPSSFPPALSMAPPRAVETCTHLTSCPMFARFSLSGTAGIWQDNYCRSAPETCVRYQRSSRGEHVPDELLPNGKFLKIVR